MQLLTDKQVGSMKDMVGTSVCKVTRMSERGYAQVTFRCPGMSPGTEHNHGSERRMQPSVTRATF